MSECTVHYPEFLRNGGSNKIVVKKMCKTFIDNVKAAEAKLKGKSGWDADVLIDIAAGNHKIAGSRVPTITRCRGSSLSYFLPFHKRLITGHEMALWQGLLSFKF